VQGCSVFKIPLCIPKKYFLCNPCFRSDYILETWMHKILLYGLINCVHAFCTGFYLYFKQQYLGLNQFVMVSTSIKLALLSTFNMVDANVAKAVFFPYCSFFLFFCLCNIQYCFTFGYFGLWCAATMYWLVKDVYIFLLDRLSQPIYYIKNKCIGHLHRFYAQICGGVMTEFIVIQHALVPTSKPAALFCDKNYMIDIQISEGILFCWLEKEDHNGRVDSTTPMVAALFFLRSLK
jgi:hypothetical protein